MLLSGGPAWLRPAERSSTALARLDGSLEWRHNGLSCMETISHYRILHQLGAGGMGEVFLANDTTLDRRVALKLLPPAHTQDAARLRRFRQEAKAASSLNHPNIVTIFEVGEADGRHFIATEFVDGETLRERLARSGRVPIPDVLKFATQITSALSAAHAAGIIHRDIKPENVMVRRDGYVKVLDFGLAKLTEPDDARANGGDGGTPTTSAYTSAGLVVGTAPYMSPEQGSAQPVDARTDVFSLGAVLYELVSGQPAFRAASDLASLAAVMLQDPPPLPADVPAPLAHLITRCLRKDPARRVQSMSDLKAALEDIESELRASNRAPSARAHRWLSVAVMAVLAAAAVVLWRPWRTQQDAPRLEAAALTTLPGRELYRSFSPDGDHVVFAWTPPGGENQDIYVQLIGSGDPSRRTTDPAHDYNPVWSPDGKWIAFFRSLPPAPTGLRARELRVIPALGGADRKIADIRSHDFFPVASYIAWAPDSSALIVTDTAGEGRPDLLTFVPLDGGAKRPLLFPHADVLADTSPALSPDGRLLAFIRRTSWASGELHAVAVRGDLTTDGQPRQLAGRDVRPDGPAWAADGRTIVFGGRGGLWRVPADGSEPASRLQYVGEDGAMPAISNASADGTSRLLYVRSFVDTNLWRIDTPAPGAAAPSVPVQVVASTKHEFHVAFAPDGARLAFVSSRSGEQEIWLAARDGSNVTQLTSLEAIDTNCPAWSPDGGIVAFSSNAAGEFDVYVVPSTGGKPRRLTTHPAIDLCPSYSLDGRWIYFTSTRSGDYRTWKMPRDGGEAVPVSPGHGGRAFESRDGSVYYLTVSVSSPLWRLPAAGGEPIKALDGVLWFNVAPVEGASTTSTRPTGPRACVTSSSRPDAQSRSPPISATSAPS